MDSYSVGNRSLANDARSEARPDMLPGLGGVSLMLGEVVEASEGGYRVKTYDADGNVERIFERVFASGDVTLTAGATVLLAFEQDNDLPQIVVTGSGGGGCGGDLYTNGVLMR